MVVESVVPVAFKNVSPPALVTEKRVVVAMPVVDAMLKRVAWVLLRGAKMETSALGVEVPMPSCPALLKTKVEEEVSWLPAKKPTPLLVAPFSHKVPAEKSEVEALEAY